MWNLKGVNKHGILSIIGGFMLHLTLGTLYCFGNLNTYITSYMRKHVPGQEDRHYSDAVWIPTLATLGQGLFMTVAGHLEEAIGVRLTLLIGSSLMSSGVYLTYFTIQHSIWLTTLTYGFLFGLGIALAYASPMAVAMQWFPKKKGLVNGFIVGGFGMGAFLFNQVQTAYLNPHNYSPDESGYFTNDEVLDRVPSVFLLLGSIYSVMQLIAIMLITPPQEHDLLETTPIVVSAQEEEEIIYQSDRSMSPRARSRSNSNASSVMAEMQIGMRDCEENLKPGQVVKSREFWILWFTFFLNTQAVGYINTMYKAFGQTFIDDDHFLAFTGAFAALFNSSGRVLWGYMSDVFGYKMCMMLVTICISILYSKLYFTQVGHKFLFAVWIWMIFFSFCGNFVLLPTASATCFGTKYSSKNYGLVMTGSAAAAPLIAVLTQGLSPHIGYMGMFILIAVFSGASFILTMFFPSKPSPTKIVQRIEQEYGTPI